MPQNPQQQSTPDTLPPDYFDDKPLAKYPPNVQNLAQQLAQYKIPLPSGYALTKPIWQQATQAASEIDPSWNMPQYGARQTLLRSFTSGPYSLNKTAINTAIQHLAELKHNAEALNNWQLPIANAAANFIEEHTGHNGRQNAFRESAQAVADELERAFRGTSGGTEAGIHNWQKSIDINASPEGMKGTVDGAVKLLAGRINALKDTYENTMGKKTNFQFLSPQSRAILKGLGYDPDNLDAAEGVPQGQTPATPAPAQPSAPQPSQPSQPPAAGNLPDFNSFFRK
jgi:hypothetical protein